MVKQLFRERAASNTTPSHSLPNIWPRVDRLTRIVASIRRLPRAASYLICLGGRAGGLHSQIAGRQPAGSIASTSSSPHWRHGWASSLPDRSRRPGGAGRDQQVVATAAKGGPVWLERHKGLSRPGSSFLGREESSKCGRVAATVPGTRGARPMAAMTLRGVVLSKVLAANARWRPLIRILR
jgi:hypothetical protein